MYRLLFSVKSKDMIRMLDTIGGRVRFFRELRGLSQGELAKAAGLHKDFISNLERWTPRYRNPTADKIEALAGVLGIPPGILLDQSLRNFFKDTSLDAQDYIRMSEGERIHVLRKWRGLSPTTLAKKCHLPVDELKQLETTSKLPMARRHRLGFELDIEPYWISLDGLRLTPTIDPKGNLTAEDFSALFNQLPKSLQEIVLKSSIALMREFLSKPPQTGPKDRKPKKR